jgi:tetratricopeptide (TPR) repeat protein
MSRFGMTRGVAAVGLSVLAALSMPAGPVHAQTQEQIRQCVNTNAEFPPEVMIDACTVAMRSGRWSGANTSWIYNNLGKGYYLKQDYDRALSQYNEALRLNPNDVYALCGRGMTKNELGDNTGGQADIARSKSLNASVCQE